MVAILYIPGLGWLYIRLYIVVCEENACTYPIKETYYHLSTTAGLGETYASQKNVNNVNTEKHPRDVTCIGCRKTQGTVDPHL